MYKNPIRLSGEQYIALVNGKFQVRKCTICDGRGWYWTNEDGERVEPKLGESTENLFKDECCYDETECGGYGFNVVYLKE